MVLALVWGVSCHRDRRDRDRSVRDGPVVARVGSETLTVRELDAVIRRLPAASQIYSSAEKKRAVLESESG
jgi:hypothetical protein